MKTVITTDNVKFVTEVMSIIESGESRTIEFMGAEYVIAEASFQYPHISATGQYGALVRYEDKQKMIVSVEIECVSKDC